MHFDGPRHFEDFIREKWPLGEKVSLFLLVVAITTVVRLFFLPDDMAEPCRNAAVLIMLAVGFWLTDAMPPFAVSMFVIGYTVYFLHDARAVRNINPDWERYAGTWSSPVIWMMMGGFFISLGIQITSLDKSIANFALRMFGTKPTKLLLGIMLLTMLLSMLGVSNTATAAMMVAIFTPLAKKMDKKDPFIKSLFLGIAIAASFGGMGTIIGSPINAMAIDAAAKKGINISFLSWMEMGTPLALGFTILGWLLLHFRYKPMQDQVPPLEDVNSKPHHEYTYSEMKDRWIVGITFVITLILWLTTSVTNIPVAAVSFVPMMMLTLTGVIQQKDIRLISWDTLLLVAGGLTLGMAAQETGLLNYMTKHISLPQEKFTAVLLFSYLTVFISNFMSSTAAASILIPLANTLMPHDVEFVSIAIGFSCSIGILLPISTPPNAIALSTGFLAQRDFRLPGLCLLFFGPIAICYTIFWWVQ
ncbi:solute carrier family 13 (sodium-dependent dicarboxylate transporter), member 2/3/5 [Chitinophaga jiangningensis]|uniref:Solute carrier family 13 (Sodium-dependent dicarboxylate transporter), member 2/3/5 n=1 Tax=Chitinophaga jiangningensis TaxID=1419482 RepID=A0A1M7ANM0_9BACT|nr:SLC13 family permease [Chitinophaga jiangningensis]SHL44392.1 solute carrier family 13 (sodium-dependent dicarboxylate transporter), member 2/3/5 [Chitinophaga jiangningensis]